MASIVSAWFTSNVLTWKPPWRQQCRYPEALNRVLMIQKRSDRIFPCPLVLGVDEWRGHSWQWGCQFSKPAKIGTYWQFKKLQQLIWPTTAFVCTRETFWWRRKLCNDSVDRFGYIPIIWSVYDPNRQLSSLLRHFICWSKRPFLRVKGAVFSETNLKSSIPCSFIGFWWKHGQQDFVSGFIKRILRYGSGSGLKAAIKPVSFHSKRFWKPSVSWKPFQVARQTVRSWRDTWIHRRRFRFCKNLRMLIGDPDDRAPWAAGTSEDSPPRRSVNTV